MKERAAEEALKALQEAQASTSTDTIQSDIQHAQSVLYLNLIELLNTRTLFECQNTAKEL